MREPTYSTSRFAWIAMLLLTACSPKQAPQQATTPPAPPPPPAATVEAKSYCNADICADATNIETSKLDRGPDFVVHRFTMKDGSNAGVYVGGYPQRPPVGAASTVEIIDGIACERFDLKDGPQVTVYCQWSTEFPTAIHAWAGGTAEPEKTQAMALIQSLRRCKPDECPWPQN